MGDGGVGIIYVGRKGWNAHRIVETSFLTIYLICCCATESCISGVGHRMGGLAHILYGTDAVVNRVAVAGIVLPVMIPHTQPDQGTLSNLRESTQCASQQIIFHDL
jgi:hypothetical protein